jgi:8-oxo-dGTP diphosphatase
VTDYRDSSGKRLTDYPRPSVAVDTAVLTVSGGRLCVALVETDAGRFRLPGTFLHENETLSDAVGRSLKRKAGIRGLTPTQLHVFDALDRDDRGWVLSVAHSIVVRVDSLGGLDVRPVDDATGLAFDHDEIVRLAVSRLRVEYSGWPDPAGLLGDEFTLLELQHLHKAIDPGTAQRDTFRRRMSSKLEETGQFQLGTVGKPARLFRRSVQS